jgi:hypothetical protein
MPPNESPREKLLLQMYDQMFNDINTHIMVVWQSVGVLIGAFAIFALAEKQVVSIDIAATLIVLIAGWQLAHLYDAGYWYNRNLAIIANIEKQFLKQSDLKDIHYYFGKHRPNNAMITHLKIQYMLGIGVAITVLAFHFLTRVLPGIGGPWGTFSLQSNFPYLMGVIITCYLYRLRKQRNHSYQQFIETSPGIAVDTHGITYGTGHGFPPVPREISNGQDSPTQKPTAPPAGDKA